MFLFSYRIVFFLLLFVLLECFICLLTSVFISELLYNTVYCSLDNTKITVIKGECPWRERSQNCLFVYFGTVTHAKLLQSKNKKLVLK